MTIEQLSKLNISSQATFAKLLTWGWVTAAGASIDYKYWIRGPFHVPPSKFDLKDKFYVTH
jgi:hypothetical protein